MTLPSLVPASGSGTLVPTAIGSAPERPVKGPAEETERSPLAVARAFFRFLDLENVPYALLGCLHIRGQGIDNDIDMVVSKSAGMDLIPLLNLFCKYNDLEIVQAIQHEQTGWYFVLVWHTETAGAQFLRLDFCTDYFRMGRRLLKADQLLDGRVRNRLVPELSPVSLVRPSIGFCYYALKRIDKAEFGDGHGHYLSALWRSDPDGCIRELKPFFGTREADLIFDAAATNDWRAVRRGVLRLRDDLHGHAKRLPLHVLREWIRILSRIRHRTGMCMAILGPDGSGKTTVADGVCERLLPAFRRCKHYHLRPHFGGDTDMASSAPNIAPHGRPPRGVIASFLKLGYWWIDYTVGYAVSVWPRMFGSTFVVFDRYYDDILVDPVRFRYRGSRRLTGFLRNLICRPDIVVLLDGSVDAVKVRKRELADQEIDRQFNDYRRLVHCTVNGYVVDGSQALANVVATVEQIALRYMVGRMHGRLMTPPSDDVGTGRNW